MDNNVRIRFPNGYSISCENSNPVESQEGFAKVYTNVSKIFGNIFSVILSGGIATIYNSLASIGDFDDAEEMMKSKAFEQKLIRKIKGKYVEFPTLKEIKTDPRAKNKSGFLGWFLGYDVSGDKVSDKIGRSSFKLKVIDGVPCGVLSLQPIVDSIDWKQIGGWHVLIATAFVEKDGRVKSIPLCRGYLKPGKIANRTGESALAGTLFEKYID